MFYALLKQVQYITGLNIHRLDIEGYLEYIRLTDEYRAEDRPISFEILALQTESLGLRVIFNACHTLTESIQDDMGYVRPEDLKSIPMEVAYEQF
jgi:hypothetical protein